MFESAHVNRHETNAITGISERERASEEKRAEKQETLDAHGLTIGHELDAAVLIHALGIDHGLDGHATHEQDIAEKDVLRCTHPPTPRPRERARTRTRIRKTHTHTIRQHTHRHTHLHTHLANRRIGTHLANIRMRTLCRWLPLHRDRVVLSVSEEGRARETNVFRNLDILSW